MSLLDRLFRSPDSVPMGRGGSFSNDTMGVTSPLKEACYANELRHETFGSGAPAAFDLLRDQAGRERDDGRMTAATFGGRRNADGSTTLIARLLMVRHDEPTCFTLNARTVLPPAAEATQLDPAAVFADWVIGNGITVSSTFYGERMDPPHHHDRRQARLAPWNWFSDHRSVVGFDVFAEEARQAMEQRTGVPCAPIDLEQAQVAAVRRLAGLPALALAPRTSVNEAVVLAETMAEAPDAPSAGRRWGR